MKDHDVWIVFKSDLIATKVSALSYINVSFITLYVGHSFRIFQ